jgi:predicted Zn-ribbon and HTH transcriptional regulator
VVRAEREAPMTLPDTCPHCKTSLIGDPIPEEHREAFGGATHGSRLLSLYDRSKDRTIAFQCPDCKERWEA